MDAINPKELLAKLTQSKEKFGRLFYVLESMTSMIEQAEERGEARGWEKGCTKMRELASGKARGLSPPPIDNVTDLAEICFAVAEGIEGIEIPGYER